MLLCLAIAACSRQPPEPAKAAGSAAPVSDKSSGAQTASVSGKVSPGPTVIVVLDQKGERTFPPQSEAPVMDQVGLTFTPDMLFVRTGQPVEFRNNDDTLHNVHVGNSDTKEPAFNVAIPTGEKYSYTFQKDGYYHVGCDIHPAMSAEIFSSSSPYTTIAESDGSFQFSNVPPGAYVLRVFSPKGRTERDVDVHAGTNNLEALESR